MRIASSADGFGKEELKRGRPVSGEIERERGKLRERQIDARELSRRYEPHVPTSQNGS
jgi:hypothetical protein